MTRLKRLTLFGGSDSARTFDDTWELKGDRWIHRRPASSPSARTGFAMALGDGQHFAVLFGGENSGVSFDETWRLDRGRRPPGS